MDKNHCGKNEKNGKGRGVGRPPSPAHLKKRLISIRLPEWLILWMDEQPGKNRALLIEEAIKKIKLEK